jgi:hypothetical protein
MSLRLMSPIPLHVMQGARAAIWARAAAGKIAASAGWISRADLDEDMRDLALLHAHLRAGAVKVWSSAFFPAVIDAFPMPVDVEFTDSKTHPWQYFVTTAPLRILGPDFELIPRGEVPAEAVEAAARELSRPVPPGTIIGGGCGIPHPPSPEHVRVAREVLRRLRDPAAVADALNSGRWIAVVDLCTNECEVNIKKVVRYHEGISVYMRRGSVDIYPIGGAKA